MKPLLEVKPERVLLLVTSISQSIKEVSSSQTDITACTESYRTRLLHEVVVKNHNFSIKHIFTLTYQTDCETALICDSGKICSRTVTREFPGRQSYWKGDRKGLTEVLCWFAKRTKRDFNLQVEIQDLAFSVGIEPEKIEQLNEQVSLVAHCEYPEEFFGD